MSTADLDSKAACLAASSASSKGLENSFNPGIDLMKFVRAVIFFVFLSASSDISLATSLALIVYLSSSPWACIVANICLFKSNLFCNALSSFI